MLPLIIIIIIIMINIVALKLTRYLLYFLIVQFNNTDLLTNSVHSIVNNKSYINFHSELPEDGVIRCRIA